MIDSILLTYLLSIIQRCRAVAICDDEYVLGWEDLQGCRECRTDELRSFVLQRIFISVRFSKAQQLAHLMTVPLRCANWEY